MDRVGYSSRCKVCNSAHRSEIERWVRKRIGYHQVSEKLNDEYGEAISRASIHRHMAEHFDVTSVARDKYEKTKLQEQHEQSQRLMEAEVEKLLSDLDMLDQLSRKSYDLYLATHSWLMELMNERAAKIPLALVSLAKTSSEELRQHVKQKRELLGEAKEDEKMDLADVLVAAWERMDRGHQ